MDRSPQTAAMAFQICSNASKCHKVCGSHTSQQSLSNPLRDLIRTGLIMSFWHGRTNICRFDTVGQLQVKKVDLSRFE